MPPKELHADVSFLFPRYCRLKAHEVLSVLLHMEKLSQIPFSLSILVPEHFMELRSHMSLRACNLLLSSTPSFAIQPSVGIIQEHSRSLILPGIVELTLTSSLKLAYESMRFRIVMSRHGTDVFRGK